MATPEERLKELGITLPPVASPVANYVPFVRTGNLLFIAGQISRYLTEVEFNYLWPSKSAIIGSPMLGRISANGRPRVPQGSPWLPEDFSMPDLYVDEEEIARHEARKSYVSARNAAISSVAVMKEALGNLDKVNRVVRVFGAVQCSSNFTQQPLVINGASDLFVDVFGEKGRHSRVAVGAQALPFGVFVEIEVVIEIKSD
jgi:enamine deaminase RidA (YjgF/YER057c/UK114 family)